MGKVIAGGAVGLGPQQYREHGIESYADTMRDAQPDTTSVFGGLLNQDDSLERFVETLALDVRGRLNLGAAGVGKTTCIQALFGALEKLDRGEEITGPYAEQIKAYHRERHSHPRGEIIALWNPKDYHKPIIFRGHDANASTSLEDVLSVRHKELIKELHARGAEIVHDALLRERALERLSAAYREREREKGDTRHLHWTPVTHSRADLPFSYGKATPRSLRDYWSRSVRSTALDLSQANPRPEVDAAMREALALGKEAMEDAQPRLTELRKQAEKQLDTHVLEWVDTFERESAVWTTKEPTIASWYASVATFLRDERHREPLLGSFWEEGAELLTMMRPSRKEKGKSKHVRPISYGDLDDDSLRIQAAGKDHSLHGMLNPSRKRGPSGSSLIIRSPTLQDPFDLFFDMDKYIDDDEPIHTQVDLGDLAYADIVFLDDGLADVVAENEIRQAFLTYLSEGRISIVKDKTQVECTSHCHLFACETAYPFRRQIFEGTRPEFDEGMERRFAIVEWPEITTHSARTVSSFPMILEKTTADVHSVTGKGVRFAPEAMDLLYQHLLTWGEPSLLVPLSVGQLSKGLFQPIAARVSGQGRETVTAEDVRRFIDAQRYQIKIIEQLYIDHGIAQHPAPRAARLVGHAHGMYAGQDFGGAFHLTAGLSHRLDGGITSADNQAKLMDATFDKGVRMTDLWLQQQFGPLRLAVTLTDSEYSQSGGPSSSAVNTYATLSVLGNIPIDQNTYGTGTVLDVDGTVGVIGGAFQKTRGSLLYHRQRFGGQDVPPMRVLIPQNNARQFLRETMLDTQVTDALRKGEIEAVAHHDLWDGFSLLSGLSREEWEPRVRDRIKELTGELVRFEAGLKEPKTRVRTGRRIYR